jgi:hypothetical protein
MGKVRFLTVSLSVLFQSEQRAKDAQKTVDRHADSTRKAAEAQERCDTPP